MATKRKKQPAKRRKAAPARLLPERRRLAASYDAAQTTDENRKHWAAADSLSASEANRLDVRKKLRERARYEVANNSYAKGIVLTLANNVIGPGPRLQINTPDPALNKALEAAFAAWAHETRLADQLRSMKQSKTVDGEAFALFTVAPHLSGPVKMDVSLIEADQFTTPTGGSYDRDLIDGIRLDQNGNPVSYDVLKDHPGSSWGSSGEYTTFPAAQVIHWYRCDRPGQVRGISELTAALPLFAQLRRFTLATLTAAETAAMFAAMLETTNTASAEDPAEPFDSLEIVRGMMTTLPANMKMAQLKAEHPTTTYDMFVTLILREIARCLNMPWNVAAGDSSKANYSSARLDHLIYRAAIGVERQDCEREVLDPIFRAWLIYLAEVDSFAMREGRQPRFPGLAAFRLSIPHAWHWPAWDYLDPLTEAQADTERLNNGTASLAEICSARGQDWQEVVRQRAAEKKLMAELEGPPAPDAQAALTHLAASGPPLRILSTSGPITLQAAVKPAELRRFKMLAYTGGAMKLPGFDLPVVVDLAGLSIPGQRIPIFRDHRPNKVIGHTETITSDGKTLEAEGVVSGTGPDAREVLATSKHEFPWQASIGGTPDDLEHVPAGQQVQANGQTFTGPLYMARKSTLREISFVPLGADGNTYAAIAASMGAAMTFEQWCLGFMTMEEFQALDDNAKAALQKAFDAANPSASTDPPADPTMPAAATVAAPTPAPVAAAAVVPIQAAGGQHLTQLRIEAAAEITRQNAIRRLIPDPSIEAEVDVNGRRQRVNVLTHAIEAGWTRDQTELVVLRAGLTADPARTPYGYARSSAPAPTAQVIEAALCQTLNLPNIDKHFKPEVLEAADRNHRGLGLQQVILMAAAQNGHHAGPGQRISASNLRSVLQAAFGGGRQIQAAFTPVSLPGVFANVANKELLQGYTEEDQTWKEIAGIRSVSDFKQVTSYRLLDSMEYEEVGPGGEIMHGKLDEESYTRQAKTYAKMLSLTRQDIINDDMGAFDDLRARLGRGAAQKFNNIFWTEFLSNASTFWTTARTNYIEGSTTNLGTDGVGLGLGVKAFRQMRSPSADGSKRIGGRPEILLVPPELESVADLLYEGRNVTSVKVADANTHAGKYRPVVCAWLSDSNFTGYSTTAWYLLRNPGIAPAVVVSFLNGMQAPTVEDAEAEFNVLGVQFRGYHDFGVDQAEYLCGVKSKGAA